MSRISLEPAGGTARRTPPGIGAQWLDDDVYFTSSPAVRKARDLAVNSLCTSSVRLPGIDLVLDSATARVTDHGTLMQVAAGYRAGDTGQRLAPAHPVMCSCADLRRFLTRTLLVQAEWRAGRASGGPGLR
jgi:hypothetical protein